MRHFRPLDRIALGACCALAILSACNPPAKKLIAAKPQAEDPEWNHFGGPRVAPPPPQERELTVEEKAEKMLEETFPQVAVESSGVLFVRTERGQFQLDLNTGKATFAGDCTPDDAARAFFDAIRSFREEQKRNMRSAPLVKKLSPP